MTLAAAGLLSCTAVSYTHLDVYKRQLSQNGDNLKATAGNYRVYATLNNSAEITYELNARCV